MRRFEFYQKNGDVHVSLSAENFEEAEKKLMETVQGDCGWRCDDDEGEDDE